MTDINFFVEHWVSLLFGLISIGIVAYCRFLGKKFKEYQTLVEEKNDQEISEMITDMLQPIQEELNKTQHKFCAIKDSYRFRLITLCEIYLERGYLSAKEYSSLSEMWKVYHELGGNSQAEEYYHKVEQLPVHD